MRPLSSISGHLKRQLKQLGWRQWRRSKFWLHPQHPYPMLRAVAPSGNAYLGSWETIDGYTLRAAARRERILPKGY